MLQWWLRIWRKLGTRCGQNRTKQRSQNCIVQVLDYQLAQNGVDLPLQKHIHIFGIILDSLLLLDYLVAAVARRAFAQLWLYLSYLWPIPW